MGSSRKQMIAFLVLTFAASAPYYYLIAAAAGGFAGGGGRWVIALMWCPGMAALVTRLLFQHHLRGFGWGWGGTRYQAWSYLLPALAGLAVYRRPWS
jgi:hypothetical protein